MKRLLLITAAAWLLGSCSSHPALREAAGLMDSNPDSALVVLDGVTRDSFSSEREKAEFDYLSAEAFYRNYYFLDDAHADALARAYHYKEVQRMRVSNLALLLVAILATLVLYFWARKSQAEKLLLMEKEENERILSTAEDLQVRLNALRGRQKGADIGLDMLDRLFEQYYVYEGTENLQPKVLKEVRTMVEGLRGNSKLRQSLEKSLNDSHDGVMRRFRTAFPALKEEDYLLYMFTVSGFSSTTISTLLEKDKPYVYNRLYRLKERVKASETEDRDFLLGQLDR